MSLNTATLQWLNNTNLSTYAKTSLIDAANKSSYLQGIMDESASKGVIFVLVTKLWLGNPRLRSSSFKNDRKLELPILHSQASAWERVSRVSNPSSGAIRLSPIAPYNS